eukprot:2275654-Prymnesium_polylepis.2
MVHGRVVEECVTSDQSAVAELLKVPIKYHQVLDPESGEEKEVIKSGHFHAMWNLAHEMKDFEKMSIKELKKRQEDIVDETKKIEEALHSKTMASWAKATLKMSALAHVAAKLSKSQESGNGTGNGTGGQASPGLGPRSKTSWPTSAVVTTEEDENEPTLLMPRRMKTTK